jgi:hypothetical protein
MTETEELALRQQLLIDDSLRNRQIYDYTADVLIFGGIGPWVLWPEANSTIGDVIQGRIELDRIPFDLDNEYHKGVLYSEQQDVILRYQNQEPLCEALNMQPCLKDKCPLYNSSLGPPVCREFKMAFIK